MANPPRHRLDEFKPDGSTSANPLDHVLEADGPLRSVNVVTETSSNGVAHSEPHLNGTAHSETLHAAPIHAEPAHLSAPHVEVPHISRTPNMGEAQKTLKGLVKRGWDPKMVEANKGGLFKLIMSGWDPSVFDASIKGGQFPSAYDYETGVFTLSDRTQVTIEEAIKAKGPYPLGRETQAPLSLSETFEKAEKARDRAARFEALKAGKKAPKSTFTGHSSKTHGFTLPAASGENRWQSLVNAAEKPAEGKGKAGIVFAAVATVAAALGIVWSATRDKPLENGADKAR